MANNIYLPIAEDNLSSAYTLYEGDLYFTNVTRTPLDNTVYPGQTIYSNASTVDMDPTGYKALVRFETNTSANNLMQLDLGVAWDFATVYANEPATKLNGYISSSDQPWSFTKDGKIQMSVKHGENPAAVQIIDIPDEYDAISFESADTTKYHKSFLTEPNMVNGRASFTLNAKPDGTRFFVTHDTAVVSYDLSTPWDVSTAYANTQAGFAVGTDGIAFSPTGDKMYNVEFGIVKEYALSTAWNPATASQTSSLNLSGADSSLYTPALNASGNTLFLATGNGSFGTMSIGMTTPYNLSTASFESAYSAKYQGDELNCRGIDCDPTGTYVTISGFSTTKYHTHQLSVPFDMTTAVYLGSSPATIASTYNMAFNKATTTISGTSYAPGKIVIGSDWGRFWQHKLGTAYNATTLQNAGGSSWSMSNFYYYGNTGSKQILAWAINPAGTRVIGITNGSSPVMHEFTMSNPWDVSTMAWNSNLTCPITALTNCSGLEFSADGTKLYANNYDFADNIYIINLGAAYTLSGGATTGTDPNTGLNYTYVLGQGPHYYASGFRLTDNNNKVIQIAGNRQMFIYGLKTPGDITTNFNTDPGQENTIITLNTGGISAIYGAQNGDIKYSSKNGKYYVTTKHNGVPYAWEGTLSNGSKLSSISANNSNVYQMSGSYDMNILGSTMHPDGIRMYAHIEEKDTNYSAKLVEYIIR